MPGANGVCSCGNEFLKVNKVRKYCIECQIIRDVNFKPNRSTKCVKCGEVFWPLKQTYVMCNSCREGGGNPEKYGPCVRCGHHYRPAPGLKGTCMSCVMSSNDLRWTYVRQLEKNRDSRSQ